MKVLLRGLVFLILLAPVTALAQDEDWGDGADEEITIDESDLQIEDALPVSLTGFFRSAWALWVERFDDNPWARGKQSLDLKLTAKKKFVRFVIDGHASWDAAYLHKRDSYDKPTLEAYEFSLIGKEMFIGYTFGPVDITLGRQIVAWGEGDTMSPLDVVNPRDLREPGLADLDDIRMAVLATRVGVFYRSHRFEAMVLHEANFGLRSPPFGPFSPLPALLNSGDSPLPIGDLLDGRNFGYKDAEEPFGDGMGGFFSQQQPLFRWVYKGAGIDLGAYVAHTMDKQGVFEFPSPADILSPERPDLAITLKHPFFTTVGTSGAWGKDSFLLKWEVAAQIDKSYNTGDLAGPGIPQLNVDKGTVLDLMVGLTYTPMQELQIGVELWKPTFLDKPAQLLFPADHLQASLRIMWVTLKERMRIMGAVSVMGLDITGASGTGSIGFVARAEVNYEFMDNFSGAIGYVLYFPSDDFGPLSGLDTHDQLFLKLRWDFTLL